ncbi:MAG: ParB/RepB/Spo0J family partition protein [Clostridiales Family XIII bacterium]|jgi:ParB family chromosome partitioning protein|nr:ParB/RepB/Spo0J family partition protein [Clostridiales Family XIII bacterium]
MVQKKPALGRGLDALFRDSSIEVPVTPTAREDAKTKTKETKRKGEEPENSILYIEIDEIKPNKSQPRFKFDDDTIQNLADSIASHGVLQPVMLKKSKQGYELVAGERRWRAARKAGLKVIPAIIRELNAEENALFAIVENMQREDLNPLEEAMAYRRIIDDFGMTQEAVAKNVGKSRPYVANVLRILKLPDEIRELIESGELTVGHANALGMIADTEKQIEIAKQIAKYGASVREAERLAGSVGDRTRKIRNKQQASKPTGFENLEEELTSVLGTRVVIDGDESTGNIRVRYYSREQLEGLIDDIRRIKKASSK